MAVPKYRSGAMNSGDILRSMGLPRLVNIRRAHPMESSLAGMRRPVRRRLTRLIRRSRDPLVVRRAMAVLSLGRGNSAAEVARETGAARSSVQSWKWSFIEQGEAGLQPQPRGPRPSTVTPTLITRLLAVVEGHPPDYGYLRSTWTSELLALLLKRQHGFAIHASTVRRLLNRLDWVWRRARPTLCIRDPRKPARMAAINRALQRAAPADTAVLYVDEADVDLNPRIGELWSRRGQQVTILSPGKNRKRYLAGALDAYRGTILYTEGESKNTDLYLRLLEGVERHYVCSVRTIYVVLDNYGIHSSRVARAWVAHHPRIRLLFQPAYHPWVNVIDGCGWPSMTPSHAITGTPPSTA